MDTKPNGDARHSQQEIADLVAQIDGPEGAAAVEKLCLAFEPLVNAITWRYRNPIADIEDLKQEARRGLVKACRTHDRKKGSFSTHVVWCIRSALSAYMQRLENPTRLPTWLMHKRAALIRTNNLMAQKLQREPTVEELGEALRLPTSAILAMLAYEEGPVDRAIWALHHEHKHPFALRVDWTEECASGELNPEEALIAKEEAQALKREILKARGE